MVAVGVWMAPSEEPVMIRGIFPVCSALAVRGSNQAASLANRVAGMTKQRL
jgi:hypothetical protein